MSTFSPLIVPPPLFDVASLFPITLQSALLPPFFPFWLSLSRLSWMLASVTSLVSSISDAGDLLWYAATRLLSDNCFQSYCPIVLDLLLPSSLRLLLRPYPRIWAVSLLTSSTSLLALVSVFSLWSVFAVSH